jgi:DNA gyrase subunit B
LLTLLYRQMPELVERGHIYIAQPPLYKVKHGKEERYLKDAFEEAQYMLGGALDKATLLPATGQNLLQGDALSALAKQFVVVENIVARLSRVIDADVLNAIVEGTELNLSDETAAQHSAQVLGDVLDKAVLSVQVQRDERTDKLRLLVQRKHHGNVRVTVLDAEFIQGADYTALNHAAKTFKGLVGEGAQIMRGEGERQKIQPVQSFRQAMQWLREQAEKSVSKQRYKGLGEMNPSQLWETTMDPTVRRLLRVQIEDAIAADHIFTCLMGDDVEPRRQFIESNALQSSNIDA